MLQLYISQTNKKQNELPLISTCFITYSWLPTHMIHTIKHYLSFTAFDIDYTLLKG